MRHPVFKVSSALVVAAFSIAAFAQTNAPAANAPASNAPASTSTEATPPVPKPDCGKTSEYPGDLGNDRQADRKIKEWQKEYISHLECLKKFVEEQQALAVAHQKARDQAANEYNDEVKAYNDQVQKAKGG
ncbi:MAG TPA: hypothetical protein VKV24_00995 [Casimicrobiaceae bacterium]|nr:hypothetical protein [Casimicrobiaceae bacterium]